MARNLLEERLQVIRNQRDLYYRKIDMLNEEEKKILKDLERWLSMDDFEKLSYEEIMEVIEDMYEDNKWSCICAGSTTFKYKGQFVKISVAKDEDDL